jgi:prepilin-type processing-associated H-X9-DG protein
MNGTPPENVPPRWQFSLGRLLLLPLAIALVFAPIAAFGATGIPLAALIGWVVLGIWFRFTLTTVVDGFLLLAVFLCVLFPDSGSHQVPKRSVCARNLGEIAKALLQYELDHGQLPPAFIADKDGKPMHSWRVLILPYLDQVALYKTYHFDEPWDGPNNRKLHSIPMPIYQCPSDGAGSPTTTSYVAVVGAGTAWPGATSTKLTDFTDGPSETIMLVEMANSGIHWMEPKDLDFATIPLAFNPKSGKGISSGHASGVNVAFADGSVHFLADDLSPGVVRALLTIHGGEHLGPSVDGGWQLVDPTRRPNSPPPAQGRSDAASTTPRGASVP